MTEVRGQRSEVRLQKKTVEGHPLWLLETSSQLATIPSAVSSGLNCSVESKSGRVLHLLVFTIGPQSSDLCFLSSVF